jgi:hypothetical protein
MDPSYQRRSVWSNRYREDFVETVLLGYPAPSLFVHEEIDADGNQSYAVVDGKQRLMTLFDFVGNQFSTRDAPDVKLPTDLRGKYFKDLDVDVRRGFYSYEFTVEYVPSTDELTINEVFDRINRNVSKLTRQELRHARYAGVYASAVETMSDALFETLPPGFPRILEASRRQMKDVEFAAQLALLVERGPLSTSQDDLDRFYANREDDWEEREVIMEKFFDTVSRVNIVARSAKADITASRLRNQGDFYSLFGAIAALGEELPNPDTAAVRLLEFVSKVGEEPEEGGDEHEPRDQPASNESKDVKSYYEAARSAANDPGQRSTRIEVLRRVLLGTT